MKHPAEPRDGEAAFLRRAIALACESVDAGGGPFGALVVRAGRVVGEGRNRVVPACDPTAHAEIEALRRAAAELGTHDLAGCVVYASAEPCPMCAGALHWARVERVVYAAGRELALPPAERTVPARQELAAEGRAPFEAWAANPDRVPY